MHLVLKPPFTLVLLFSGALIYLLDLFCNSTHPQVRTQTAELFSKMTSDKLMGPKVRLHSYRLNILWMFVKQSKNNRKP